MSRDAKAMARVLQTLLRSGRGRAPNHWLLLGCVVVGAYLFAEPMLEERLGVDLPGINTPGAAARQRSTTQPPPVRPQENGTPQHSAPDSVEALIRSDRQTYTSPAGLRYTSGTVHGHHLRHLMAHTEDAADRPVHGVFDSKRVKEVVALVDAAYRQANEGQGTRRRVEGDRTIYVVDMGRGVGYVGGRSGARRGRPRAEHIQLVLVGDKLITAYPVIP